MGVQQIKKELHGKDACACVHCEGRRKHLENMNDGLRITLDIMRSRTQNFFEHTKEGTLEREMLGVLLDVLETKIRCKRR